MRKEEWCKTFYPLIYDKIIVELPDILTSGIINDIIEKNENRNTIFEKALYISNLETLPGDRFRVRDDLEKIPNGKLLLPLLETFFYGNFYKGNNSIIGENTEHFINSVSIFIALNELIYVFNNGRFSFPIRDNHIKNIIKEERATASLKYSDLIPINNTYLSFDPIIGELLYHYHTLDFPIHPHTENLIKFITKFNFDNKTGIPEFKLYNDVNFNIKNIHYNMKIADIVKAVNSV